MNKKLFYDKLRVSLNTKFNESQVSGIDLLLDEGLRLNLDPRWIAYVLATAWWETARTMQPIKEYGSPSYLKSKPYWPYIGRGYVQLTWADNYKKYGLLLKPDDALKPEVAKFIIYDGMIKGIFTGKKLSDYFNDKITDWKNARKIVNGLDKADAIGGFGKVFYEAILAGQSNVPTVKKGFWRTFLEKLFGG